SRGYGGPYAPRSPFQTQAALCYHVFLDGGTQAMPRGVTPRQPARTGRQDRVALTRSSARGAPEQSRGAKDARVLKGSPARRGRGKSSSVAKPISKAAASKA